MQCIRAAFRGEVDLAAGSAADLGRVRAALHLELVDGIDGGREAEAVAVQVHGFDAVVVEAVLRVARAVGRHADGLADGAAQAADSDAAGRAGIDAGREQSKLDERAAIERELHHLLCIDDGADGGVLALQEQRAGGYFDGLRGLTDGERNGKACDLVDAEIEASDVGGLESVRGDGDCVRADGEKGKLVVAIRIGKRLARLVRFDVLNGDFGVGD